MPRQSEQVLRLKGIWNDLLNRRGAQSAMSNATFNFVTKLYQAPNRHYHGLHHVLECFDVLERYDFNVEHPECLGLSIIFHDAIYSFDIPQNNETSSAALACCAVAQLGLSRDCQAQIDLNIRATIHSADAGLKGDAAIMADIDLYGLAKPYGQYLDNTLAIRNEYPKLSDHHFYNNRLMFLKGMLQRRYIYSTELFRTELERRARQNIAEEINEIKSRLKPLSEGYGDD